MATTSVIEDDYHVPRIGVVADWVSATAFKGRLQGGVTMSLDNLLSGLVGAVVGGLLAIAAAVITMTQQRSLALAAAAEERRQSRLAASRDACVEVLASLVTIKLGLDGLATQKEDSPQAVDALNAAERLYVVHNSLVADPVLQSRVDALIPLLEQWRRNWAAEITTKKKRRDLILDYMEYLNQSIRAHLDDRALPSEQPSPDLESVR